MLEEDETITFTSVGVGITHDANRGDGTEKCNLRDKERSVGEDRDRLRIYVYIYIYLWVGGWGGRAKPIVGNSQIDRFRGGTKTS